MPIAIVLGLLAGQNDAPRRNDDLVTVSGCIRGNHLMLARGTAAGVEYPLRAFAQEPKAPQEKGNP